MNDVRALTFQMPQFFSKFAEVFELAVHRGKAHVGNIVEAFEFCHDEFANVLFGFYSRSPLLTSWSSIRSAISSI